ncbi:MAG: DDE-type integrase/transposase/recombinase [Halioglobus sp.]
MDVYLQAKRDGATAKRFFKRLLRSHGGEARKIVADKPRSYSVAHRELIPDTIHSTQQYENNLAEESHEATKVMEEGCGHSSLLGKRREFWVHMLWFLISSIWVGTWLELNAIGISG